MVESWLLLYNTATTAWKNSCCFIVWILCLIDCFWKYFKVNNYMIAISVIFSFFSLSFQNKITLFNEVALDFKTLIILLKIIEFHLFIIFELIFTREMVLQKLFSVFTDIDSSQLSIRFHSNKIKKNIK